MSIRLDCSRWLALLLSAAALLLLAPQPASAHGGHDHGGSPVSQPASDSGIGTGVLPQPHGWSRSCPGSPGNPCCCSDPTACPGNARIVLVNTGGWVVFAPVPAREWTGTFPGDAPLSRLPPSSVLPRAPPLFS